LSFKAYQNFGTGGSPSTEVSITISDTVTLTSTWQRFSINITVPSITGKTLGTNGDSHFYFAIGQMANTSSAAYRLDITGLQLEVGTEATPFEHRSKGEELTLCKRYYLKTRNVDKYSGDSDRGGEVSFRGDKPGSSSMFQWYQFPVEMRAAPTLTTEGTAPEDLSSTLIGTNGFRAGFNGDGSHYSFYYYAEAEL